MKTKVIRSMIRNGIGEENIRTDYIDQSIEDVKRIASHYKMTVGEGEFGLYIIGNYRQIAEFFKDSFDEKEVLKELSIMAKINMRY